MKPHLSPGASLRGGNLFATALMMGILSQLPTDHSFRSTTSYEPNEDPTLPKCRLPSCRRLTNHKKGYCSADCCKADKIRLHGQMK